MPPVNTDISVLALHNGDHACIVWGPNGPPRAALPGCLGFAIQRKLEEEEDAQAIILDNYTSFNLNTQPTGQSQPSTVWPIQKFIWWDYAPTDAQAEAAFQYRLVPMQGTPAAPTPGNPTDWTKAITINGDCGDGISCYFNRGIVAAEWVSRALEAAGVQFPDDKTPDERLADCIKTPGNELRDQLGGVLRTELLALLDGVIAQGGSIFAALYELNDPELLGKLKTLRKKANVILANGAFTEQKPDENADVRAALKGQINLFDRLVPLGHFAHNKFVVFCDQNGKPVKAWTGSTNWTMTGLCTQANNGLLLDDANVAAAFMQQWERLHAAGSDFPASLLQANSQKKSFAMGNSMATVWFTPTQNQEDLQNARRLINGAQNGILFLMFEPGAFETCPQKWTLLQSILYRHQQDGNPDYDSNLFIRGVVNQEIPNLTEGPKAMSGGLDPMASAPVLHSTALISAGNIPPFRTTDDVLAPKAVNVQFGPWVPETLGQGVKIHSKVIVIDPFGTHPVVMTGSHNMGYKASSMNDDNLVIIENNSRLAQAYAVNILAIYQQYRTNAAAAAPNALADFQLKPDASWQDIYLKAPDLDQMNFWLAASPPAAAGTPSP